MIKIKKINYSLLIFPIISLIGGIWQGQYTYDGYHWGFVFSNALDILEGKMPYKEIFLEYGIVMPLIHAITLFCFKKEERANKREKDNRGKQKNETKSKKQFI